MAGGAQGPVRPAGRAWGPRRLHRPAWAPHRLHFLDRRVWRWPGTGAVLRLASPSQSFIGADVRIQTSDPGRPLRTSRLRTMLEHHKALGHVAAYAFVTADLQWPAHVSSVTEVCAVIGCASGTRCTPLGLRMTHILGADDPFRDRRKVSFAAVV